MTEKPFIKLVRTPRGYYFFDVNKDTLVEVSDILYNFFDCGFREEMLTVEVKSEIDELKQKGFLSTYHTEEIRHPENEAVPFLLNNYMKHLILQVTQACNLCCIYCPYANSTTGRLQRKHSQKTMSFDVAKKAIDFFFKNSSASEDITIGFYGGEPLIEFGLIKKCVEYINLLFEGRKLTYVLTTNATLLTEEMIHYFDDNNFILTFSMDGPEEIHNKNRFKRNHKGTYNAVMKKLEKAVEVFSDSKNRVGINMVVNPQDDFDYISSWMESDIVSKVSVSASVVDNTNLESAFTASEEYVEKYEYHLGLALLNYTRFVNGLEYSPLVESEFERMKREYYELKDMAVSLPRTGVPIGPCISGQHKLFVNVDGVFYPCERVNENSQVMKIGNINIGIETEKVRSMLNVAKITESKCRECWAFMHCDLCQCYADGVDALDAEKKKTYCQEARNTYFDTLKGSLFIREAYERYTIPGKSR